MYIERSFRTKILSAARFFPAVILTGARQSGKTTLLRHLFPDHNYVTLDLPSLAEQAEHNPEAFLQTHRPPLLIDEVQYAPGLFRHLKQEIDRERDACGRFILTGSQQFPLMQQVSDSLAGRCAVLELENLTLQELHGTTTTPVQAQELLSIMVRGQFPALWKEPDFPAADFHASYLATYLERDVRQIMNVASLRDFERFIRILASRSGNMLNKTEVAREVGVSVKAIGDWISVLQVSGQIVLLEPWFANFGKRIVKTPKLYFTDTGLLCFLLGLDARGLAASPFLGAVWETLVFGELRKHVRMMEQPGKLWYYRDQRAREVDFLFEKNGSLHFLECKWKETPQADDAQVMLSVRDELRSNSRQWSAGKAMLLAPTRAGYTLDNDVQVSGRAEDILSG